MTPVPTPRTEGLRGRAERNDYFVCTGEEVLAVLDALAEQSDRIRVLTEALRAIEAEGWKGASDDKSAPKPNASLMWELASNALEDAALSDIGAKP